MELNISHAQIQISGYGQRSNLERMSSATRYAERKENVAQTSKPETLNSDELQQIQQLKARDSEVRAHEQAHLNAAGGIAVSAASFTFQTGPDGKRYAVGGEVQISTSPVVGDPEATLKKAETIRRAALAPAQPSSQDYSVAADAAAMANQARIDLLQQNREAGNNTSTLGSRIDIRA
ncbi:MAG: putative metalloprotease CJM1_0395 family protein [Gammaproteobacteria bacterium]